MDLLRVPYTCISGLQASSTEPSRILLALICKIIDMTRVFNGKLLKHRQVTCKRTDDNSTLLRNQRGATVSKLSRWLPFGIAIFAVAHWRTFLALIRY